MGQGNNTQNMEEVTRILEEDPVMLALIAEGATIETEQDANNLTKIKLMQKIPAKIDQLLQSGDWLLKLIQINFALKDLHQEDKVTAMQDQGRMPGGDAGKAHLVELQFESGKKLKYVLKCSGDERSTKIWGKVREAIFYDQFMPEVRKRVQEEFQNPENLHIPQSYLSVCDPSTGRYVVLMEYYEDFMPLAHPLTIPYLDPRFGFRWKVGAIDQSVYERDQTSDDQTYLQICTQVAIQLSYLHGTFWKDRDQLMQGKGILKAASWYYGEEKDNWHEYGDAICGWVNHTMRIKIDIGQILEKWSEDEKFEFPLVAKALQSSMDAIDNWDKQVAMLNSDEFNWTIVHGDFHLNNMVWGKKTHEAGLVDFDFVGFWNPTIDLFWFLCICLPVDYRRKHETAILQAYHQNLQTFSRVPSSYTYDQMIQDLRTHGIARFLAKFSTVFQSAGIGAVNNSAPTVEAFMEDYNVDPSQIQMPAYGYF